MTASAAAVAAETPSAMTAGKRKNRPEGESGSDRAGSERASSPALSSSRSSSKPQIRHRASIACSSCRERRIRCVVPEGETECSQCRKTGSTCIIKDDDERRRPISKAYMSSLSHRIALLEDMLRERGVVPPPAVHPPKTRHEAQLARQREEQLRASQAASSPSTGMPTGATITVAAGESHSSTEPKLPPSHQPAQPPTPPGSGDEDIAMTEPEPLLSSSSSSSSSSTTNNPAFNRLIDPLLLQDSEQLKQPPPPTTTRHLLSTRGTFIPSPTTPSRIRYFGPTANSHVHARPPAALPSSALAEPPEQRAQHRAALVIATLPTATHDHLLRSFWERYNAWQPVVDEAGFAAGRGAREARLYSPFLHLAMLAVGYRFADWERDDVQKLVLGAEQRRESTLHREARALVQAEVERPGGVASVQGLLLMAELEFGVGRDGAGWMFSGMASRLAFDIGLHVQPGADVSELEAQTRRQAMSACVMFDRRWALFLGRPTSVKMQDVRVDIVPRPSAAASSADAAHRAIHRQMFELLELAGRVADFQNAIAGGAHAFPSKAAEDRAYLHFVGLERLFHNWYRRLNETELAWRPVNIKTARAGFFLLHLQFHACMILLHRPWAKYGPLLSLDGAPRSRYPSPESPAAEDGSGGVGLPPWMTSPPHQDNRASMSRSMCTQHAIRIARIFWHHRQRFDARRVPLAATQHAGTAALALMAALAHKSAELDHQSNLRYLQVLSAAIYDMSHLYQPAASMYQLLKAMLVEIRSDMVKSSGLDVSSLLGRYPSTTTMMFGGGTGAAAAAVGGGLWTSAIAAEDDRAAKRRRLSSVASLDYSTAYAPSPSLLGAASAQAPAKGLDGHPFALNPAAAQPLAPEPAPTTAAMSARFDMDFLPTSFMDFLGSSEGAVSSAPAAAPVPTTSTLPLPGAHDWAAGQDASPAMLIPTVSGDLSCLSSGGFGLGSATGSAAQPTPAAARPSAPAPEPTGAVGDNNNHNNHNNNNNKNHNANDANNKDEDDDVSADKTIEDWLAEPSMEAAPAPAHPSAGPAAAATSASVAPATANPAPAGADAPSQPPNDKPTDQQRAASLSHATADGTPICRDPYVLSLQTELGIGFGLGPDEAPAAGAPLSPTATASTAGCVPTVPAMPSLDPVGLGAHANAGMGVGVGMGMDVNMDMAHIPGLDGLDAMDGIDAMDWFHAGDGEDGDATATTPTATTSINNNNNNNNNDDDDDDGPEQLAIADKDAPARRESTSGMPPSSAAPAPAPAASSVVPVTPVTLDELVQSVEEAVGSARARARARAAAAAAAAAAASATTATATAAVTVTVTDATAVGVGSGVCGREEAVLGVSPRMEKGELDFLAL
ncbi:hypothetical protein VTJ83DRAFT_3278 [Remersonia thermophila]|uniref:Zn(2)-C6 fungal-type domain-containing protein n=1 Tax=Remersonia thermophila TaxID=72144 RepID=A0ABR4DDN5_9PEZI